MRHSLNGRSQPLPDTDLLFRRIATGNLCVVLVVCVYEVKESGMGWVRVLFLLVFGTVVFSGCAAKMAYKRGLTWEAQGEMYRAGQEYVDSLNRKSDNPEVLGALSRVALPGYEQGVYLAVVAQNNADFPKALALYKQLKAYTGGLSRHGVLNFTIIDIDRYIEDMAVAAATERYNQGRDALRARNFESAINHFNAALRFKNGFKDSAQLISRSHYEWAESLLSSRRYQDAANRFVEAHRSQSGGYRDALDRAAGIHFTIGVWFTDRGFCQAGWSALKKAKDLVKTPVITAEKARAKDCAIRDIAVVVLSDAAQNAAAGVHVETILGEQLAASGAAHAEGERYATVSAIRLRERDVRPGRNVFTNPSVRPFERLVLPRVNSVDIGRSGWTRSHRQASAMLWDRCAEGPGLCEVPVTVSYLEHARTVTMTVTGDVMMFQAPNGDEQWHYDYARAVNQKVMYADTFTVDEIAVTVGTEKALGVVVLDKTVRSLANGSRVAKFGNMAQNAIQTVVDETAKTMVEKAAFEAKPPAIPALAMQSIH